VLGQGNFVLTLSEGIVRATDGAAAPTAFYDLFRIEEGQVVEHWDVTETIPPSEEWKNDNGKF
jgi:predicted SnoaL-like aldol condensation-catalyzing enzyme